MAGIFDGGDVDTYVWLNRHACFSLQCNCIHL